MEVTQFCYRSKINLCLLILRCVGQRGTAPACVIGANGIAPNQISRCDNDAPKKALANMSVVFHLPATLREFAGGRSRVEIEDSVATLAEALSALWRHYPGIRDRMATEHGQVREHINVFIGDENVRYSGGLMSPVLTGAEITILPAVSGG